MMIESWIGWFVAIQLALVLRHTEDRLFALSQW